MDASAATKLILDEDETEQVRGFLAGELHLVSSLLLRVELVRAVRRSAQVRDRLLRARSLLERFELVELSRGIFARAEEISPSGLRTLDAIHLATALEFAPRPDLFLCYDRRLGEAARSLGLSLFAPGAEEIHEP